MGMQKVKDERKKQSLPTMNEFRLVAVFPSGVLLVSTFVRDILDIFTWRLIFIFSPYLKFLEFSLGI